MAEEKKGGGDKVSQSEVKKGAQELTGNPGSKSNQDPAKVSGSSLSAEGVAGVPENKPAANTGNFAPQQPVNRPADLPHGPGNQQTLAPKTSEQSEEISEEEAESRLHQEMVNKFGSDYVRVHKKDNPEQKQTFSRRAWDLLGPAAKDGTKEGWKPDVKVPKEVKALKEKKEGDENE